MTPYQTDHADMSGLPTEVRLALAEIAAAAGAWCPALSPDGTRVAYVSDRSGIPRLEVATLEQETHPAVVSGPGEEVVSVAWSPDGRQLAYLVSPYGSICAELHVVAPDGSDRRRVAGGDPRATVFAGTWTSRPGHYACTVADGVGPDADIVLVDTATGAQTVLATGGFLALTAVSADERRVLARRGPRGQRRVVLIDVATGEQQPVVPLGAPGGAASEDGRFGVDGRSVYLRAALPGLPGADRTALLRVPLDDDGVPGPAEVVVRRGGADLDGYAVRADGTALCVWNADSITELQVVDLCDGSVLHDVELPLPVMPGWSLAGDGRSLLAELTGPGDPRGLWRVDLPTAIAADPPEAATLLPSAPRRPNPDLLVQPARHRYLAADGLELDGWLYTPPGVHGANRTVVSFHGGPEGQERPVYSPVAQGLVAMGLTVFAPNIRGSGGRGGAFMAADDGPAREASFADVVATVEHLVDAGIALPGRVGAHGWSYGGYLTLVALTRWPDLFAAGVSLAGMSDLRTFFAGTEPWMAAASVTEYGHPVHERHMLAGISPMTALEELRSPVLLAHGNRDSNVPVAESVQAYQGLSAVGAPCELLLLPGEGHTIVGRENLVLLTERVAEWFDRWL
ncbi:prolyl oligopeptidase family serine peptidase [Modestobacter sp. I12A-02628]|uniref:S9 family peptidase n=1 Tax=Goekera deserti TaxID=2497753 RepID=A0A7K3WIU5_9ACTN|nr:prolyl oligopeptidase family serine peptidase [Goekera deserti]MPQ99328.1 prolyl oligopeptidase family serine peptidase [Goekera deserti]NDI50327.1 prolyl oligopeptidase family serine peptidase [Goekera deserti]NEL56421.1 S9 family peptidase [Goekera deserti]